MSAREKHIRAINLFLQKEFRDIGLLVSYMKLYSNLIITCSYTFFWRKYFTVNFVCLFFFNRKIIFFLNLFFTFLMGGQCILLLLLLLLFWEQLLSNQIFSFFSTSISLTLFGKTFARLTFARSKNSRIFWINFWKLPDSQNFARWTFASRGTFWKI